MKSFIILSTILVAVASQQQLKHKSQQPQEQQHQRSVPLPELIKSIAAAQIPTEEELKQNLEAKYEFSSKIEDHINDLSQERSEVRDGASVTGKYSYSDGYYMRTVYYKADETGYHVTGEEVVPLEGPKIDLNGVAIVDSQAHGQQIRYSIKSVAADREATGDNGEI